jgi:capsular polysaccharide transport system permease protein
MDSQNPVLSFVQHEPESVNPQPRGAWQIQRAVVFALLLRELKTRFGGRWLGAFTALSEPLGHALVVMTIYVYLHKRTVAGADYVTYLVCGMVPFFMFRNMIFRMMEAIDANRALLAYRQVKPIDSLIARAILEIGIYSVVYLIVLTGIGWFTEYHVIPDSPLDLMVVSAALLAAGFGLGLTAAVLTNGLPPMVRRGIMYFFIPVYLLSGTIFPVHSFPQRILDWLLLNPVLHALELMRGDFFSAYQKLPGVRLGYVVMFGLVSLTLGLSLYRVRRERLLLTA